MVQFQLFILFVVAELSCLRLTLVSGGGNLEFASRRGDVEHHRSRRWLWGDSGCGLIPGCEKCSDGLVCKKCRASFIPVEYDRNRKNIVRCIRSCPVGYNITAKEAFPRICVRTQLGSLTKPAPDSQVVKRLPKQNKHGCLARNCVECHPHNPGSCLNCSQGFYMLQKKIMGNVRCVRHCPMGFTPTVRNDGEKFCKDAHSKCLSVVPNCAKCLDSGRCRKCRSDFYAFFNKSEIVCVQSCPGNYIAFNSSYFGKYCKKHLAGCRTVANCARCPDEINCRRCKPKYFKVKTSAFSNSTCVVSCPRGFAKRGRRCQRVREDGCFDEYCLTCKEGWFRINYNKHRCQRKCPKGFYILGKKQKFCLKCLNDCEQCINGYDCIKCNPETSRLVHDTRTSCTRKCPSGYTSQEVVKLGKVCRLNS